MHISATISLSESAIVWRNCELDNSGGITSGMCYNLNLRTVRKLIKRRVYLIQQLDSGIVFWKINCPVANGGVV